MKDGSQRFIVSNHLSAIILSGEQKNPENGVLSADR